MLNLKLPRTNNIQSSTRMFLDARIRDLLTTSKLQLTIKSSILEMPTNYGIGVVLYHLLFKIVIVCC